MPKPQAVVIARQGDNRVGQYLLDPGEYVIGRDPSCAIPVEDAKMSRHHAKLAFFLGQLFIEDLGSANGTYVDGVRVEAPVPVRSEQKIQLGTTVFQIRATEEAVVTPLTSSQPPVPTSEETEKRRHSFQPPEYQIGDEVARGGMGAILQARDRSIERTVAMKVVLHSQEATPDRLQRFKQEAKITGQLEHPNIVPVHELGVDAEGRVYYTMKFVHGVTLRQVLHNIQNGEPETIAQFPLSRLLTIFQKLCDAVAFAHSKGVIHRDLKPENVMIGDYGEVLAMDWGLAKVVDSTDVEHPTSNAEQRTEPESPVLSPQSSAITLDGQIMGTPQFMAPEQAMGHVREIDARSDIFSLGAILYNILTLHPPVSGTSVGDILQKIRTGEIPPPTSFNSKTGSRKSASAVVGAATLPRLALFPLRHCPNGRIPSSLSAVCMKALALKPQDRYPSVKDLQNDIEAYQGGFATGAEQAGALKLLWLLVKRHKVEFGLSGAALLIILVLASGFVWKVTSTLNQLRGTAPTFYNQAQALISEGKLYDARQNIEDAIALKPDIAEYHYLKGNIYQTLLQMEKAEDAYQETLRLNKGHALAEENLELCRKILRDNVGMNFVGSSSLQDLHAAMSRQGRLAEAVVILGRLGKDNESVWAMLKGWMEKGGLTGNLYMGKRGVTLDLHSTSIIYLSPLKGVPLAGLNVSATKVSDLTPLQGMPLELLEASFTPVTDLSPVKGMPLATLSMRDTRVHDLSPLQGMALTSLDVAGSPVTNLSPLAGMPLNSLDAENPEGVNDLSPLRGMPLKGLKVFAPRTKDLEVLKGMPLEALSIHGNLINDLSPLRGMRLKTLDARGTPVRDLSPLEGMPLETLYLNSNKIVDLTALKGLPLLSLSLEGCASLQDLTPLKGMLLKNLGLAGCNNLQDLTPLADCKELESLSIPIQCKTIEFLRALPNLKALDYQSTYGMKSTAEFWKEYDAKKGKNPGAGKQQ